MTARFANSTTVTRDDLCRAGLIVNRPPDWRRWGIIGPQLSADELERRGFHAAAHARRSGEYIEYFEDGFVHHMPD
jgi:hypothetical protein